MNMKVFIVLILAVIYGSLAVIIIAAIAHDLVARGRRRRRDMRSRRELTDQPADRSRFPRDDADVKAARAEGQRPD
jgi:hypothetical protein